MPTINVSRDRLFTAIGKTYTEKQFDELCFEFGLELDKVTEETHAGSTTPETIYCIEIPANRYDLLCIEGLAQAIRIFEGIDEDLVEYKLSEPETLLEVVVEESASPLRPFIVAAVLRGVDLDQTRYDSLIELQDKLHQNICRRRTLVAIGTHDLNKVHGPFRYECRKPEDIVFVPLNQEKDMDGNEVMEVYENHAQLKEYLPIIKDKEKYPVVSDSDGVVLSLPPIINGDHSKIGLETKDIFVECTATDHTKALVTLNILVAMFSRYCKVRFQVEPVVIKYADGRKITTPDFSKPTVIADLGFITRSVGVDIEADHVIRLLKKVQLPASITKTDASGQIVSVDVPIIRSDVIHACDIMTDVAVAYGFNNIPEKVPATSTVGGSQPLNSLCDAIRHEGLMAAGYTEVLTWVTVSHEENFGSLRRQDEGNTAVKIGNPKRLEFQECRTSLLPGLLKTLRENRKVKVPIQIFEVGDVVLKDEKSEVRASNRRRLAAIRCSTSAGFEVVRGLLDHVMRVIGVTDWYLSEDDCNDECFFEGRRADIWWSTKKVGTIGWLHPEVLQNYELGYPCSALEMDLEAFL
eukprot:Plantae.Rhodophyta-Hildenbrandia_rubra.ctg13951.p2 GENE.Plantae.Rhodophyta-Hildenbrandia_rubra.ctg13951~~Plantae.Rhodophyta-Hildenbrandia_rubra.ctg13951.p2  ORF type:complete len:580 (-),score=109.35 Plantae.Rhodophyta-Hildenbrandia_rubra.ctg13951:3123-4862(-)